MGGEGAESHENAPERMVMRKRSKNSNCLSVTYHNSLAGCLAVRIMVRHRDRCLGTLRAHGAPCERIHPRPQPPSNW